MVGSNVLVSPDVKLVVVPETSMLLWQVGLRVGWRFGHTPRPHAGD
jgi:hypothetical protein